MLKYFKVWTRARKIEWNPVHKHNGSVHSTEGSQPVYLGLLELKVKLRASIVPWLLITLPFYKLGDLWKRKYFSGRKVIIYFCRLLSELDMPYVYFSIPELGLWKSKYTNIYLGSKEISTFLYMLQNFTSTLTLWNSCYRQVVPVS